MKKNELFLGYFAFIFSLTLLFILVNSFGGRTEDHWRFFYAFTQQSNILVLLWLIGFGLSAFGVKRFDFVRSKILMTALTVYISITYFIVALVLTPIYNGMFNPVSNGGELWLHHLSPIIMWLYFFLVKGKGTLSIKNALLTLIYPIVYVIVNLILGATVLYADGTAAYAYGFIDPNSYGNNYLIFGLVILGLLIVFSLFTVMLTKLKNYIDTNYHLD